MKNQLKKCTHCQSEGPTKAKKCSHCHGDLRGFFAKHSIFSGLVLIIGIFTILISTNSDSVNNITYKVDFQDGSSFLVNGFNRIDVEGSGGEGCLDMVVAVSYTSESSVVTNPGETIFRCGNYTVSPPYPYYK